MFDWNKLCNSGKVDMTGTGGRMLRVSPEELARHCTDDDLWTAVRGNFVAYECVDPLPYNYCMGINNFLLQVWYIM